MGRGAQWVAENILNLDLGDGNTYVYTSTILRGWTQYLCTICKLYLNKKIKELKSVQSAPKPINADLLNNCYKYHYKTKSNIKIRNEIYCKNNFIARIWLFSLDYNDIIWK